MQLNSENVFESVDNAIYQLHSSRCTGTLHLSGEEENSAGLVFNDGEIICAGYKSTYGMRAFASIFNSGATSVYFKHDIEKAQKCLADRKQPVPSTPFILSLLNHGNLQKDNQPHTYLSRRKILLIDSGNMTRRLTETVLLNSGYTVYPAPSAGAGIDIVYENPLDLIIMDTMLDDMNVQDALDDIQSSQTGSNVPIILLSSHIPHATIIDRVDAYIMKPFSDSMLTSITEKHIFPY